MDSLQRQQALELARQGDNQALGELLQSFRPYVRAVVQGICEESPHRGADDSDVIQDAMVEAQRSFGNFRGGTVAEFVAWLRVLVIRCAGRSLRKVAGTHSLGPEQATSSAEELPQPVDPGSSPSARAARLELAGRITDALAQLPSDMQQVLLGRFMDNLSHAEIAQRLGKSEGAVRMLFVRALAKLKEIYRE